MFENKDQETQEGGKINKREILTVNKVLHKKFASYGTLSLNCLQNSNESVLMNSESGDQWDLYRLTKGEVETS